MAGFYHEFAARAPPAGALRTAQLNLRRAAPTSHPFYWAGFVTIEGR